MPQHFPVGVELDLIQLEHGRRRRDTPVYDNFELDDPATLVNGFQRSDLCWLAASDVGDIASGYFDRLAYRYNVATFADRARLRFVIALTRFRAVARQSLTSAALWNPNRPLDQTSNLREQMP